MDIYSATSDVKIEGEKSQVLLSTGLISDVLPEVQKHNKLKDSQTGVSTPNTQSVTNAGSNKKNSVIRYWYVLRTTYGRKKKAYDYLVSKNIESFYPTKKSIKIVGGKRMTVEESRIPNIFFAYGTEDELKCFVYDNINLPFLRFYYRHIHVGNKIVKVPLIVPDNQISSLKIICAADSDDIVASSEEITKFKVGQTVRITDGKFKGVIGKVARYQNQQRVGIVIDGLLTVCTAYVPSPFIEKL